MLTIDLAVNGLIIGVFYALMAIGLSLIFGILKVVNFAHGEFYMVGAYAYTGPALTSVSRLTLGPVIISGHRLVAALVAIAVIAGVGLAVRYSYWGRQIQAVAQNRVGASLAGIDTAKASAMVFALAGGLAALSGALLANIFNPTPDVGAFPAAKSYVIVVLGGMGSVPGAILGSIVLGVLESFGGVFV